MGNKGPSIYYVTFLEVGVKLKHGLKISYAENLRFRARSREGLK